MIYNIYAAELKSHMATYTDARGVVVEMPIPEEILKESRLLKAMVEGQEFQGIPIPELNGKDGQGMFALFKNMLADPTLSPDLSFKERIDLLKVANFLNMPHVIDRLNTFKIETKEDALVLGELLFEIPSDIEVKISNLDYATLKALAEVSFKKFEAFPKHEKKYVPNHIDFHFNNSGDNRGSSVDDIEKILNLSPKVTCISVKNLKFDILDMIERHVPTLETLFLVNSVINISKLKEILNKAKKLKNIKLTGVEFSVT